MKTSDAITVEQASFVHRNSPPGILGSALAAPIAVVVFWDLVPHEYVVAWATAMGVLALYRLHVWRVYGKQEFTLEVARRSLRDGLVGTALSGVLWGAGSLLFYPPGEIAYQLAFPWAISMLAVGAMFSYSAHVPTYMAFFLPSTIPAFIGLALQGTIIHVGFAVGYAIYIAVVVRFVSTYNKMFMDSQKLRFENVDLVGQLTGQVEAVKSANLAKSRFLAAASHDLRQPMHALNLYLGGLARLDLSPRARGTLGNASQCAQTMDEMFRALLDISKLDAGAVQPEPRAFPVGPLLERIRLEFEPQVHGKGLALHVAPCSAWVRTDPAFLERVLRNLTANAVRHTQRGRILIGCRRRQGMLRIAVHDTGVGIAPDEQRLVFEEFYQVGNQERDRSKGMGLGLAIVDRLVKLMHARIELASRPGRGSAFTVELPLAEPVQAAPAAPHPRPAEARDDFSGSLVAVIDDEEMILGAMRTLLEQWQCTVVTAASGRKALELLSTSPRAPDAILCDYRLAGGETGLAVIEALRAEFNEDIPALLITGDTGPERLREIQASGLDVLHKPAPEPVLREALAKLLSAERV